MVLPDNLTRVIKPGSLPFLKVAKTQRHSYKIMLVTEQDLNRRHTVHHQLT